MGLVVVTGIGAASALGTGIEAHRDALWAGRDGIRHVERFDTKTLSTHIGATWPGWEGRRQPEPAENRDLAATAAAFPLHELALVAAREAWSGAGVVAAPPRRIALVFGTCFGHGFKEFSAVTDRIAAALDIRGPAITISTACSSSTNAIGLGRDLLLHGHADVVVAGGADTLLREGFAGFSALGVLSPQPCAPFSEPTGTTMGEGAAFLILERAADAASRSAPTWATILGYGLSADGFHETTPDPDGAGIGRAIRGALGDAGLSPRDIDFVSAHATGTESNDRIEWSVIERELGAPAVSGSKGHVGHTQGAAGGLELVLALLCHREGRVPPTLHFRGPRPGCPADPIAGSEPRVKKVSRALKLSAAFGGANAVLAYGCGEVPSTPAEHPRGHVVVMGAGVVGPAGAARMADVVELTRKRNVGPCREVDLDSLGVDARRLDRSARWLTAAAGLALPSGERRERMDRSGLFVAATRMPEQSSRRCTESIMQRGVAGTSASAFARMSVNAPAGACSQALGLLGPTSTLSSGDGSGLLAVLLATEWLTFRDDATTLVAGGVDEPSATVREEQTEGAACLALKRSLVVPDGAIVVAGWAMGGRGDTSEVVERAMIGLEPVDGLIIDGPSVASHAKWLAEPSALGVVDGGSLWGVAEGTRSCVMAAVAAAHIAAGHARSVLVVAATHGSCSVALVLKRAGA